MGLSVSGYLVLAVGACLFLIELWASVESFKENEYRAGFILLGAAMVTGIVYGFPPFITATPPEIFWALAALPGLAVLVLVVPPNKGWPHQTPPGRIDERDIMFARSRLEPGTQRFADYYRRRPENHAPDSRFRSKPGLMSPESAYADPVLFAAAQASFDSVQAFHQDLDASPAPDRVDVDLGQMADFVREWSRTLGALSVGVTDLRDYHLYSHRGRTEPYGEQIALRHTRAIAITVPMDWGMMAHAPLGPAVMESSRQYLNAGAIGVQVAGMLRNLGYASRAHIDGNYLVVCPLVARDAGLGEIGRMGLLMTPELGPRVRIAVVTTEMDLPTDIWSPDNTVMDFCGRCRKCVANCPAGAIPGGEPAVIDGVRRWKINQESCFTYWCAAGTDCGRCVRVCPFSHPDSPLHNLVRRGVRVSPIARTLAIWMDDLLYGRLPRSRSVDRWLRVEHR